MTDDEIRKTLERNGVPLPDAGLVLMNARWTAGQNDWYVLTEDGKWYWFGGKEWLLVPQGPLK